MRCKSYPAVSTGSRTPQCDTAIVKWQDGVSRITFGCLSVHDALSELLLGGCGASCGGRSPVPTTHVIKHSAEQAVLPEVFIKVLSCSIK